ncbi:hypothetical protein [Bradyrhizobium cytisi]|uniref:hypothetical protein n=1 Tax=Bradyrhizobium cytisi TaxID=515489 RepID=UPI001FE9CC26|nr:hypothetical protein [Bradyrhizobium cytisi]
MAIYRLLEKHPMGAEEVKCLVAAYEQTLRALGIQDRGDPLAELVARKVFEIGQEGLKQPGQICKLAVKELRIL